MGLGASQARLLTLTSRLSSCSLKQQNLAMSKLRLAADKDNLSYTYSEALNNQTLKTKDDKMLTLSDLKTMGYKVIKSGDINSLKSILDGEEKDSKNNYFTDFYKSIENNPAYLINSLLNGYFALVKDGKVASLDANTDVLTEYDKTDDAAAEARYNSELNKIDRKEKAIDLQMRRLETEYSSITTEINSVQSLVTNHAQKDFQLFS